MTYPYLSLINYIIDLVEAETRKIVNIYWWASYSCVIAVTYEY